MISSEEDEKESVQVPAAKKKIAVLKSIKGNYNKPHCCLYCQKILPNIARHLETVHKDETEVAKVLLNPKKSKSRRKMWLDLVNRGDFEHNHSVLGKGHGLIIPKYAFSGSEDTKAHSDYLPCANC